MGPRSVRHLVPRASPRESARARPEPGASSGGRQPRLAQPERGALALGFTTLRPSWAKPPACSLRPLGHAACRLPRPASPMASPRSHSQANVSARRHSKVSRQGKAQGRTLSWRASEGQAGSARPDTAAHALVGLNADAVRFKSYREAKSVRREPVVCEGREQQRPAHARKKGGRESLPS